VYHVPPSAAERRAKCRPCGNEFTIPNAIIIEPPRRRPRAAPFQRGIDDQLGHARIVTKSRRYWLTKSFRAGNAQAALLLLAGVVISLILGAIFK
jgi:hypothetical protein